MGVVSPGGAEAYGVEAGLMYSFPVTCEGGKWSIVQGLEIDDRSRKLMDATAEELKEEKQMAEELIAAAEGA
jgi:malate dehydrogenase